MPRSVPLRFRPAFPIALLTALLLVLWLAGGASRADASGQVIVRAVSWGLMVLAAILAPRLRPGGVRAVALLLAGAIILAALQLLPLPPALWQALPGRALLSEPAVLSGQPQPWRPWSMVPSATVNALSSLVVPLAALVIVGIADTDQRARLPALLLGFAAAAMLVGLLQFSGASINNPFINDTPGEIGGIFANRNHFALLMAIGCVLAPVWAFLDERDLRWRAPLAAGLVVLFLLTILATGSRAGVVLGGAGIGTGVAIVAKRLRRVMRRGPRLAFPALIAAAVAVAGTVVLAGSLTRRSVSIDRVLATELGEDMRGRALPIVLSMVREYLPVGAGLGGFDPLFRMHEPFALLKPTYFNHAHNDWLEIVLDAGLFGGLLLAAAVAWWTVASARAWRSDAPLPKLGSAIILLVFAASLFDYPGRTPTMMAVLVIAGAWLGGAVTSRASALPDGREHL